MDMLNGMMPTAMPGAAVPVGMLPQNVDYPPELMGMEVDALPESAPPEDPAESALIARFEREARVPSWMVGEYEKIEGYRRYVHTEAFAENDSEFVGCNFILRAIEAKVSQIFPADPGVEVKPMRMPNARMVRPEERQFQQEFAQTCEVLVDKLFQDGGGIQVFQAAAQDAMTAGIEYVKVMWHEDRSRDPIGMPAGDDAQDQMDMLRRLSSEFARGEWGSSDARYAELMGLVEYMHQMAVQQMVALPGHDPRQRRMELIARHDPSLPLPVHLIPEPETWQGATLAPVKAENLRLDWSKVASPELFRQGDHVTEKTFMHPDAIVERWHLSEEEAKQLGTRMGYASTETRSPGSEPDDPSATGLDDTRRGEEVAVYERWDRRLRKRFVWAAGMRRFLHQEVPQVVSRHFFPYVLVFYNRQSGRFLPISEVKRSRRLQDEINQMLTEFREARRAAFPRYAYQQGAIDDEDLKRLESAAPFAAVPVRNVDDVQKAIVPIPGVPLSPQNYDPTLLMKLIELNMGAPLSSSGMVGQASFATEVASADAHMQAQAGRHGAMLVGAMRDACEMVADMAVAAMPAQNVQMLLGEGAVWPVMDREMIFRGLRVQIAATGNDRSARRQNLENWAEAAKAIQLVMETKGIAQQMGYDLKADFLLERIMREMDVRVPVEELMTAFVQGGAPGMNAALAQAAAAAGVPGAETLAEGATAAAGPIPVPAMVG